MGNIESAYQFHTLSLYANQKMFSEQLPIDYEKFKYDTWLEVEKKLDSINRNIENSPIKFRAIPPTPCTIEKLYSNFSKECIKQPKISMEECAEANKKKRQLKDDQYYYKQHERKSYYL